ncbi:hypothetical protein [Amycolatopsis sp. CA-230715]|uniref:hypothetical protein n=1 Tax=Amycolatopsis sp. CA-230715 TaxID=2745196 RepID=UPI001C00A2A5|nr:hypothetical protein [Amycolatopsis sp. CA-230715]QWF85353.1 hypothetical protein HUW46_08807 [Amycolatopsis sp. CA-230715]
MTIQDAHYVLVQAYLNRSVRWRLVHQPGPLLDEFVLDEDERAMLCGLDGGSLAEFGRQLAAKRREMLRRRFPRTVELLSRSATPVVDRFVELRPPRPNDVERAGDAEFVEFVAATAREFADVPWYAGDVCRFERAVGAARGAAGWRVATAVPPPRPRLEPSTVVWTPASTVAQRHSCDVVGLVAGTRSLDDPGEPCRTVTAPSPRGGLPVVLKVGEATAELIDAAREPRTIGAFAAGGGDAVGETVAQLVGAAVLRAVAA